MTNSERAAKQANIKAANALREAIKGMSADDLILALIEEIEEPAIKEYCPAAEAILISAIGDILDGEEFSDVFGMIDTLERG